MRTTSKGHQRPHPLELVDDENLSKKAPSGKKRSSHPERGQCEFDVNEELAER